ncbi:MAG: hypothetical protein C4576_11100 [Desulfobacteraceae bacterium]|nr:MAG: hypothetical protein C4576_11100 [Desulfobacteraceae bacterium]
MKDRRNDEWSSPDGDGIITCTMDVGAVSTLRGRRRRKGTTLRITDVALWPPSWRELLKEWLKQGGPRRKWEGLLKCAGGRRVNEALQLLDSMLMAGLIEIEERRSQNRWQPLWVVFLEEETIRESVGLPNREKLWRLAEEQLKVALQNSILEDLEASLPGMPPDRAIRRHTILVALDHWISEERNGTRRDFAFFAMGDTKGVSSAEWNWLEGSLMLEDIGIFRHTPAIWLRAPLSLVSCKGTLDLRGVPDCIALTPETINDVSRIEGAVGQWLLLENRTVFERIARKNSADGVIWTPGFAPRWWKDGVARILDLCPAPALVACDPDPAGIEIALDVGQLFTERSLLWKPWYMDVATLSALKLKKSLSEDDRDRLKRLLSRPLPESLKDLSLWMIENGEKGEQEGILL